MQCVYIHCTFAFNLLPSNCISLLCLVMCNDSKVESNLIWSDHNEAAAVNNEEESRGCGYLQPATVSLFRSESEVKVPQTKSEIQLSEGSDMPREATRRLAVAPHRAG